jgi:hypothetical protein
MKKMSCLAVVFLLVLPVVVFSQISEISKGSYNNEIPSFKEVMGYELGSKCTPHYKIIEYIKLVSERSDRVLLKKYGETYEGRPLYYLVISDPANLNRLDELKSKYRNLADPRIIKDESDAEDMIENMPGCVWMSYNVHGNEASCSEAALGTIYHLAASEEPEARAVLQNLVIVLDPILNPDGRDRYVNWYNSVTGKAPNPDPNSAEHQEPWPGGRSNHYYFDLNRDWIWLTQQETKYRIAAYREFMPQVHVDFHEMGYTSSYFFFPSAVPVNPNIPDIIRKWHGIFGKRNAEKFDEMGWEYFTKESFDLFYPGYGDTWPSFNGAVGMTYEQAGGSGGALNVKIDEKRELSLIDRVYHHYVASITTLKTAAEYRKERLLDFYKFFKDASDNGKKESVKSFIFKESGDKKRDEKLVNLLLDQGIEVKRTLEDFELDKGFTYFNSEPLKADIPAGSYIIDLDQPQRILVKTLFEPEQALPDTFFYDITAWSVPMAFGLDAYYTKEKVDVKTEEVRGFENIRGELIGDIDNYAFLIPWGTQSNALLVYKLLKEKYKGSYATKDFKLDGRNYKKGAVVFFNKKNGEKFKFELQELTEELGALVYGVKTGYSETGIDLGSNRFRDLKLPKIGILTGSPVSSTSYGSIWHSLDRELDIDFSPIWVDRLSRVDLSKYNVIVFPPDRGNGGGYKRSIDSLMISKLKEWIRKGGVFIGIGGGAYFATKGISGLTNLEIVSRPAEEKKDKEAEKIKEKEEAKKSYEEKMRERTLNRIPGTIFKVNLDVSHPLAYGNKEFVYILKRSTSTFKLSKGFNNIGVFGKAPKISGYFPEESEKVIPESVFFTEKSLGRGHIILFSDELNFRSFWNGLTILFLNSLIFGPSL